MAHTSQPPQHAANGQSTNTAIPASSASADGTTPTTTAPGLSPDEIALYDRQIRLWGAQAQERIRSANILLLSLRALGTEIAKNLTLAGVSSLTIIDDEPVTDEDLGTQYFLREQDLGKPRAEAAIPRIRELNPRVTIRSHGSLAALLQKDQTYYTPFSIIIASDHDFLTLCTVNTCARFAGRPFYAAGIHGPYGYLFADLVGHDYVIERSKPATATPIEPETLTRSVISTTTTREPDGKMTESVTKREIYCPLLLANSSPLPPEMLSNRRRLKSIPALLPCVRALFDFQRAHARLPSPLLANDLASFTSLATGKARELQLPAETLRAEFLRSFIQNLGAELLPTAAFVGARLSEDVIHVLGRREQPVQNFAFFDAEALAAPVVCLYSPPPELALAGLDGAFGDGAGALVGVSGGGLVGGVQVGGDASGVAAYAGGAVTIG